MNPLSWPEQTRAYVGEGQIEFKKVTWPTREELIETTKRITLLAVAIGVLIGLMDWLLQIILVDGVAALTR